MRLSAQFDASRSSGYFLMLVLLSALTAGCDGGPGRSDPTWSYSLSYTTGVSAVLSDIPAGGYTVEVWYDNTVDRDGPVLDTVLAVSQEPMSAGIESGASIPE